MFIFEPSEHPVKLWFTFIVKTHTPVKSVVGGPPVSRRQQQQTDEPSSSSSLPPSLVSLEAERNQSSAPLAHSLHDSDAHWRNAWQTPASIWRFRWETCLLTSEFSLLAWQFPPGADKRRRKCLSSSGSSNSPRRRSPWSSARMRRVYAPAEGNSTPILQVGRRFLRTSKRRTCAVSGIRGSSRP